MTTTNHNGGPQIDLSKGYTLIHNDWANHPLVGVHSDYFRFWVDLLQNCAYGDGTIRTVNGHVYELRAGELVGAISYLAARWNVTPKRVRTFIDKAAEWRLVTVSKRGTVNGTQRGTQAQTININNYSELYERYEKEGHAHGHAEGHAKGTQEARKGHESNYINNTNYTKNNTPLPPKGGSDDFPPNVRPVVSAREMFADPYFSEGVGVDEKGRLRLMNGEYARWLKAFNDDAAVLKLALEEIQASINPKSQQPVLAQVRRRLAQMVRDSMERDKRYAKAAASKAAVAASGGDKRTDRQVQAERIRAGIMEFFGEE